MMTLTSISKATKHFLYGLLLRLTLLIVLPALMDDGLLLRGVRYTDIDYDVFTDAAAHVAEGRSPYRRHTYRYTPFLAALLSLPMGEEGRQQQMMISSSSAVWSVVFSTKYFGKILFCVADAICGYIILMLRARSRTRLQCNAYDNKRQKKPKTKCSSIIEKCVVQYSNLSPEFIDALWWLYNPLPINICTRGSAEALVVLLPVLLTVALTTVDGGGNDDVKQEQSSLQKKKRLIPIPLRACLAGILHGIGIHCKLYPVIYTVSFMANFSRQEQQYRQSERNTGDNSSSSSNNNEATSSIATRQQLDQGWTHTLSEQMAYFQSCMCCTPKSSSSSLGGGFPWKHPIKILMLALLWIQRLFLTPSSILFLLSSIATMAGTTYAAVHYYGHEALEEGLLYHFGRIDHRHNYSMYWYWIYLLRGRLASAEVVAPSTSWVGNVPLIPQILSELIYFILFVSTSLLLLRFLHLHNLIHTALFLDSTWIFEFGNSTLRLDICPILSNILLRCIQQSHDRTIFHLVSLPPPTLFRSHPMGFASNVAIIKFTIRIYPHVVGLCVHFGDVGVEIASTSVDGISFLFCCKCESSCCDIEWI